MNLHKVHLEDIWFTNSAWAVFRYPDFSFDLKSSTDSNLFRLFGSSFNILSTKYAEKFKEFKEFS